MAFTSLFTPLSDRNGRDLCAMAPADSDNITPVKITLSEDKADAINKKMQEQKRKITAAEEKIATQERTIQQLSSMLAKAHGSPANLAHAMNSFEQSNEVATLRMELQRAETRIDEKDDEITRLQAHHMQEVISNRMKGSSMQSKDADIDGLRRELDSSRGESARLRAELEQTQKSLERKTAEVDDLLPSIISCQKSSTPAHVMSEVDQLRRERDTARAERDTARAELNQKKEELKQAYKLLEQKDVELHALQMASVRSQEEKDREIARLQESGARANQAKECIQLTRMDHASDWVRRAEEVHDNCDRSPRIQILPRATKEEVCRFENDRINARLDDFNQARINMALKMSEQKAQLDRRERNIAMREAGIAPVGLETYGQRHWLSNY